MRCLQSGVAGNWRTPRSQRTRIQRDHSREQGPSPNRLLGSLVRTVSDGGASRGANRPGPRWACSRAEGRYGTLPGTCSTVQHQQHSEFRSVLPRSASVPAGRSGGRKHHGELAHTRGMTEGRTRKAQKKNPLELRPIGVIRSKLKQRSKAPKQGSEGAPDAWLEVYRFAAQALDGLAVGDEI